jgi:hypothetical protein
MRIMHCISTLLEDMYDEMLQNIRAAIDPEDVMSLAGGWKFQLQRNLLSSFSLCDTCIADQA